MLCQEAAFAHIIDDTAPSFFGAVSNVAELEAFSTVFNSGITSSGCCLGYRRSKVS